MSHEIVFIGFGSNQGDRFDYCDRALNLLALLPGSKVTGVSSLYETEPVLDVGDPGSEWFLNGVIRLETALPPVKLLETCQEVERALGRDAAHRRGPRTMDLDILFYGSLVSSDPTLVLPHPRVHLRRFALLPLAELNPDWQHPVLDRTLRELLKDLAEQPEVHRVESVPPSRYGPHPACHLRPTAS